jgi:L-fucose isomerase-like protein
MNPIRVGFVPSYRFGDMTWCQKMRSDSLEMLASVDGLEVVVPQPPPNGQAADPAAGFTPNGVVRNLEEGLALAGFFRRQAVDALVLCPLDFGDERSAVKIAEQLSVPVLLYATKEPPALGDAGMSRASDSYCGNLAMAAGLHRRKIPFRYAGIFFPGEPELLAEVRRFAGAVAVVKALRNAQIGQVGLRPQTFETVAYDEIAMARKFGQNVIHAELSDLTARAERLAADDPAVQAKVAEIMGSVAAVTVAPDHIVNAARFELALEEFFCRNHLSAMAVSCWPTIQRLMKLSVCALYGRLTGRGMLTACETDILGSLSMLASYTAGLGQVPPHFVDWTIQHRADPNLLLAWHCGNAPVALANRPEQTALRTRLDMTGLQPIETGDDMAGLYQFQLKPGPVTFCRLAEYDGDWKMLIARGEIVPSDETLAGTWSWVRVSDHARLYRTLVEEGFIHHASMIHGDQSGALELACRYLDIQPVTVD